MALSYSFRDIPAIAPSGWSAYVGLYSDGISIAENTTNVRFTFKVRKDSGSYLGTFPGSITVTQVYDNSTQSLGTLSSPGAIAYNVGSDYVEVFSQNMTIKHDEETGEARLKVTYSFSTDDGNIRFSENKHSGVTEFGLPLIIRKASILSVANFTELENPTITYDNPNGATDLAACISFTGGNDDIAYRSIPNNGGSYTFYLTAQEKETLINGVTKGTGVDVRFYVRSVNAGKTFYSYRVATFSLTDVLPYIQPVVVDMNSVTNALTGDVNTFIKYFSDAAAKVNATAKKGASIVSYKITNGNRVKAQDLAQFTEVENPKFIFSATDSRSNTTTKTITVPMVEYVKLTCNQKAEIKMDGETSAAIKLNISGNFFDDSFGAVNNTLKIEVRHTQNDGNMGDWVDLTQGLIPNFVGNTYNMEVNITGLAYDVTYTIQCRVTDKLMTVESSEYTVRLIPVFDWSNEDFNFNVPVNMNGETVLRHNKTANNLVISASGGHIYIRPGGTSDTYGEIKITPQGNIELTGDIVINGVSLKNKLSIS